MERYEGDWQVTRRRFYPIMERRNSMPRSDKTRKELEEDKNWEILQWIMVMLKRIGLKAIWCWDEEVYTYVQPDSLIQFERVQGRKFEQNDIAHSIFYNVREYLKRNALSLVEDKREVTVMYQIGDAPWQYEKVFVRELDSKVRELLDERIKEIRIRGEGDIKITGGG